MYIHYVIAIGNFITQKFCPEGQINIVVKAGVRQTTRTLKPSTSEVNNNDHLITMQWSPGKLWVLVIMWILL